MLAGGAPDGDLQGDTTALSDSCGRTNMPDFAMLKTILRETLARSACPRVPEPDSVMDAAEKVAAYTDAGRDAQVMMQSYLLNCAHICDVICPGDTVVDLACGPATLLAMVAELNPETRFIGVDLSEPMLQAGRAHLDARGIDNVELRTGDITRLDGFPAGSVDAVVSTFSLHHLPDLDALGAAFAEADRVLAPDGGLFLFDFAHLKSERSIEYFATRHAHLQSPYFTQDYRNSLRAAFHPADLERLAQQHLRLRGRVHVTAPMRLMLAIKGDARQTKPQRIRTRLRELRSGLPPLIERDLQDILRLFRTGGLETRLLD